MKRTVKRLLPIFICLVIICSIVWYLFAYDRGFMQDALLAGARYFEEQGKHNIATWMYNQACLQSGNDDDVIIELAERFKKMGNYTQAEIALYNAIKEGATADLYIALSKTYVEQDKLLDAVDMLENITNPEIKAQLDSMRPSVPVAAPVPGYYSQYINVSLESADGYQLYVTTDGDFPSIKDVYKKEITLVGGENQINVIAVNELGLVSAPCYLSYIVGGVIEEVTISDPVLNSHLRELLNLTPSDKLFSDDLWTITSLTVPDGVEDLSDLSWLPYLKTLTIDGLKFESLYMLSSLKELKELTVRGYPIAATDLSLIGSLPNLECLTLNNCSLTNISGLSNAVGLVTLDLSSNAINDLSPLSFLPKLATLNLSNNAVTNLSPLSAVESLCVLDVSYNSINSLAPLTTCPKLNSLFANNNQLIGIPAFDDPTVLTALAVSNNDLTNVTSLSQYTSLTSLELAYNQITDVSALAALDKLVYVDISNNQITTLPGWSKSCALVELVASNNKITSVAPLQGLMCLNNVYLDYNKITNVTPLAECQMLVRVSVYGNSVKDVSMLTDLSIIVNYNPM